MKIADHVFDHFRAIVRRLVPLSEKGQIEGLKTELLSALERADVHERRVHCLQDQCDALTSVNFFEDRDSLPKLERRVVAAARASGAPEDAARRRRDLEDLRRELVETDLQCQALDAFCRLLLGRMDAKQPPEPAVSTEITPSRFPL
jgi:hypothetical protein